MSKRFLTNVSDEVLEKKEYAVECVRAKKLKAGGSTKPSKAAVKLFKAKYPSEKRPDRFIERAWSNYQKHHTVLVPASTGRTPKVSTQDALEAAAAFKKGSNPRCRTAKYGSIEEALRVNPKMKKIAKKCKNISPRRMLAAMKKADSDLRKTKIRVRPRLEAHHLEERLCYCRRMKRMPQTYFKRIFWGDAKKFWITGPGGAVWSSAEEGDLVVECEGYEGTEICLFYYALVNWLVGAVELVYVSGTTLSKRAGNHRSKNKKASALTC